MVVKLLANVWSGKAPQDLSEVDRDILDRAHFPPEDPWFYSGRFLQMLEEAKGTPEEYTPAAAIQRFHDEAIIRQRMLAALDPDLDEEAAVAGFERLWPKLSVMLKEVPFYTLLKEFGMDSAFIYTYFVELSGFASALELATGYSWDLTGRYRKVPPCDAAYQLRVMEPTFRSFVQRIWFTQQTMLRQACEMGWNPEMLETLQRGETVRSAPQRVKAMFLGGGTLPQLRNYELTPESASKMFDITVYDKDPKMPGYLQAVYAKPIVDYGIDYRYEDFAAAFQDESLWGTYDLVLANGVMSYYNTPEQTAQILSGVEKLLRPGGWFVFDRQVFELSMKRCVFVLAWRDTGMKPDMSAQQAIGAVKQSIEGTNLGELYYEVDSYNQDPAIVNFRLTKLA